MKENFEFKVTSHLSRTEAFHKDKEILVIPHHNTFKAVGDKSHYEYKTDMTLDQAQAYVAELNQNKLNSKIHE